MAVGEPADELSRGSPAWRIGWERKSAYLLPGVANSPPQRHRGENELLGAALGILQRHCLDGQIS